MNQAMTTGEERPCVRLRIVYKTPADPHGLVPRLDAYRFPSFLFHVPTMKSLSWSPMALLFWWMACCSLVGGLARPAVHHIGTVPMFQQQIRSLMGWIESFCAYPIPWLNSMLG
jgi:hypothetical protein